MPEILDYHFKDSLKDNKKRQFSQLISSLGKRKTASLVATIALVLLLPVTLFAAYQQQNFKQRAASQALLEAESPVNSGALSIKTDDPTASGGKYIEFGNFPSANLPPGTTALLGTTTYLPMFSKTGYKETIYKFNIKAVTIGASPQMNVIAKNPLTYPYTNPAEYTFGETDQVIDQLQGGAYPILLHGHSIIYDKVLPSWIPIAIKDRATATTFIQNYTKTVVSHFCGRMYSWDVVNEVFGDGETDGSYRNTFWYQLFSQNGQDGRDYVRIAFEAARAGCPGAKLFYNEFHSENNNTAKSNAVYNLAIDLKNRGILDGVGFQTHQLRTFVPINAGSYALNLARFNTQGIEAHMSEVDVGITGVDQYNEQATRYRELATVCYQAPNCKRFTIFGLTDGPDTWAPDQYPTLFTTEVVPVSQGGPYYKEKPAYTAVKEALHL